MKYKDGSDRFAFLPGPDGRFYLYIPPMSEAKQIPNPSGGWLIVLVAAPPLNNRGRFGRSVVIGWMEDATFVRTSVRPEYAVDPTFRTNYEGEAYCYNVVSRQGRLLSLEDRDRHLPPEHGLKLGSASRLFVRGEHLVDQLDWRRDYAKFAEKIVADFKDRSLEPILSAEEPGPDGPTTYEHKRRVEKAAELIAKREFEKEWIVEDVTSMNLGFDFDMTPEPLVKP